MLTRFNDWGFGDVERTMAEFDALRREMNRLFEGGAGRTVRSGAPGFPRMGLFDRGSELVVRAELPGVVDKDLDITVDQGLLTLRGRRTVTAPEGYAVHRQERGNLEFARSFTLPCRVNAEKTTATLKHGMLTLVLPKAPEDQPRQIAIRTK
jgi:HSP20 family protein